MKRCIVRYEQRPASLPSDRRKIASSSLSYWHSDTDLQPEGVCRRLHFLSSQAPSHCRIDQHGDHACLAISSCSSSSRLAVTSGCMENARYVAARPGKAGDKAKLDRVAGGREDDRDRWCRCFGCKRSARPAGTGHLSTTRSAISRRQGGSVRPLHPVVFDRHVVTFDVAGFVEALAKRRHKGALASDLTLESRTNPTTGSAGCCARAASGQAAAIPPRSVMNSRRFIRSPRRRWRAPLAAPRCRALAPFAG